MVYKCFATVITGLEQLAECEIRAKLECETQCSGQGRVYFTKDCLDIAELRSLCSVERLYLVIGECHNATQPDFNTKDTAHTFIEGLDWDKIVAVWRQGGGDEIRFKMATKRSGPSSDHHFTSIECSQVYGGAVNDLLDWRVDLTEPTLRLEMFIRGDHGCLATCLTPQSLGKRDLVMFGPTTLRCTISYAMLTIAELCPGDVVLDPLCGTGSIIVQGQLHWPSCYFIGADNHEQARMRCLANLEHLATLRGSEYPSCFITQDSTCSPFRDGSVDCVVSDLPFGKKMGSALDNLLLYPALLNEWARVCAPPSDQYRGGRCVLLSQDNRCMTATLRTLGVYWQKVSSVAINMGSLHPMITLLQRTAIPYTGPATPPISKRQQKAMDRVKRTKVNQDHY